MLDEKESAINTTSAKVTFSKELENNLTAADFTVADKATGDKLVVKSVKVADDKKSATVEFYSEVEANATYTVDVKDGEATASGELVIGSLQPATIEVADQTVTAFTDAEDEEGTPFEYKVKDANGVDVTNKLAGYTVKFETTSSAIDEDGNIKLAAGNTIKVKVVITDADKKVVAESAQVSVTAEGKVISQISNYTVSTVSEDYEPDFTVEGFKPVTTIANDATNKKLFVEFKDQFGKVTPKADDDVVTYTSSKPLVAVIDENDGTISPLSNGSTDITVTVKNKDGKVLAQKVVTLKVTDAAKADKVELDKTALTVSTTETAEKVAVTVTDQYGEALAGQAVTAKLIKDQVETEDEFEIAPTDAKGTTEITLPTVSTPGTYTLEVSAGSVKTTATVTVKAAGEFSKYVVKGLEDSLDLYDGTIDEKPTVTTMTPAVTSVDADGLTIKSEDIDEDGITFTNGKDKDGVALTDAELAQVVEEEDGVIVLKEAAADVRGAKAGDTFKVNVKVDGKIIASKVVTVKDSTPAKTYSFYIYTLNVNAGTAVVDALKSALLVNNQAADEEEDVTFSYVPLNSLLVPTEDGATFALAAGATSGTTTVYVKSVNGQAFETPVKLTVNVKAAE